VLGFGRDSLPDPKEENQIMLSKRLIARLFLCPILLALVVGVPAFAGSAVVGSVAGSMNATVGGQTLLPNTTLFSGDSLQVRDGVAVIALGSTSRMVFGRDTVASFLRASSEVTVLLDQGDVSLFHAENSAPVRVKVGDVSVVPLTGFKTLGEVVMLNGALVVTTKEGELRVNDKGKLINVAKGKSITVYPSSDAPQAAGNPPSGRHVSGATLWGAASTIAGGTAAVLAGIAISRAGNANDNASTAASNAAAAASAASAAASAASAAASLANAAAIASGCVLNLEANEAGKASPYTPPTGVSCGNPATW